ncbi:MAG: hypothetical protein E6H09_06955 [Bacteroidetes bacterium]|jgi:hypothetical protein|nr:MAG: hypothetical protein E6H09_06955 [Bacteroidota bacterium]
MTSRSNKKNLFKLFTISLVLGMLVCEGCDLNRSKTNSTSVQKDPDGNCVINTSGHPNAKGINMDVSYPCSWIEVQTADNDKPTLIKQVGIMPEGINANIGLTVMIIGLNDTLTSDKLDKLRDELYSKDKINVMEGTISKDTLEINGVKGGEIITRKILESGQILYNLNIQLYYENNMVHLIYMVGAPTETEAAEVFEQQKTIFEHLAKRTKFYRSVKS